MDTHIFDNLPVRVVSVKETVTTIFERPSRQRLERAQEQGETLEDTLHIFTADRLIDVAFEMEKGRWVPHNAEDYFCKLGYRIIDVAIGIPISHFTLRAVAMSDSEAK